MNKQAYGWMILVALVAAGSTATAGKPASEQNNASPPVNSRYPDAQAYVNAHNAVRTALKAPANYPGAWAPLAHVGWSDEVAAGAQSWAEHLRDSKKCGLVHSDSIEGENLAGGKDMDAARAVALWAGEERNFRFAPVYDFDKRSGHYSQLVWRKTTHIGCGRASCGRNAVVVCRYSPAGNRIGRAPF